MIFMLFVCFLSQRISTAHPAHSYRSISTLLSMLTHLGSAMCKQVAKKKGQERVSFPMLTEKKLGGTSFYSSLFFFYVRGRRKRED